MRYRIDAYYQVFVFWLLLHSFDITRGENTSLDSGVVINGGFEDGSSPLPWRGRAATISISTESSFSGSQSVLVSNRNTAKHNSVRQDLVKSIVPDTTYEVQAWVKLKNKSRDNVDISIKYFDSTGAHNLYISKISATSTEWTKLSGTVTLSSSDVTGTLKKLNLHIKGPAVGVDFYLDAVSIHSVTNPPSHSPSTSSVVANGNFETGDVSPWRSLGSTIKIDNSDGHNSAYAVRVTNRNGGKWSGVKQDMRGKILPGIKYQITAWAKIATPDVTSNVTMTIKMKDDLGKHWHRIGSISANDNNYLEISDTFILPGVTGTLEELILYASGPDTGINFLLDDVVVQALTLAVPTASPALAYTPSPSMLPGGPYVAPETSSEQVIIPDPPEPNLSVGRSDCPHKELGLLDWNNPSTWPKGSVPTAGENVILPSNSKVVVTESIAQQLGIVSIPSSSELIFGERENSGITVHAAGFQVDGAFRAGSDTCRLATPLTITLHGSRPSDITTNPMPISYKGIAVTGTIGLHGKRYYRTWTRLAKSASVGDNFLLLQNAVNWEPGQEIVLVTTALKDSKEWHQNEIFVVKSVGFPVQVGSIVYLESSIAYNHIANNGYQAEVGLLSRMITIQGSQDDSEPTDPDPLTCTGDNRFGDTGSPCTNKDLTGYGGHIMVYSGGTGFVEGIELFRMGQTNVLGRYPMHFHLLGNTCEGCYFRDSSVHRSFYRCISIHGTHNTTVSENVAYDVTGYCYYLEDGVEEDNTISFNLAALVHTIGTPATGNGQVTPLAYQSPYLTLPADVSASGYYITNMHNNIIGNAASGGWAGFAFPVLYTPLGPHKNDNFRPSNRLSLTIDGNTAHSSGWWWGHAGGFYIGGALYYAANGQTLIYNAGRDQSHTRSACLKDRCAAGNCNDYCTPKDRAWNRLTNTKTFLMSSVGLNSWSGGMEIINYEAHDVALSVEALQPGFWIDQMLVECRSGENLIMPKQRADKITGNGFFWYDTRQEHIITSSTFRNCGYRSNLYNQYDTSPTRGCGNSRMNGCSRGSTTFGFLTHSDQFTPELMQATRDISFEECGRRFRLYDYREDYKNVPSTVSTRGQNWMDVDGSVSGLNEPTMIGSGSPDAGMWWKVEPEVIHDPQGPLEFIKQKNGPNRGLGHIRLSWDSALHNTVGRSSCQNGQGAPCPALGRVRHYGPMFDTDADPLGGLPVTANPDIAGPVGGFGWLLQLDGGAPHTLSMSAIEVLPNTPLLLGIAYPKGTSFTITANAAYCSPSVKHSCVENFKPVGSVSQVRASNGNTYHFDSNSGLLTIRVVMFPKAFTGAPNWQLWDFKTSGKWGSNGDFALDRFERSDVLLPIAADGPTLKIAADCNRQGAFCRATPPAVNPVVCSAGFEQVAYDKCCRASNLNDCRYP